MKIPKSEVLVLGVSRAASLSVILDMWKAVEQGQPTNQFIITGHETHLWQNQYRILASLIKNSENFIYSFTLQMLPVNPGREGMCLTFLYNKNEAEITLKR
jgi:hypothetical protein